MHVMMDVIQHQHVGPGVLQQFHLVVHLGNAKKKNI
jgi:hypothetical protein